MTALWIILGIFAFFFVLFSIPIHIVVEADSDVSVYARFLFVKYSLFPMKKRKKKPKTTKKAKKQKKSAPAKAKKKDAATPKKKKSKREIIGLVKLILKLVGAVLRKFPKHFRVRILRYQIVIGTKDAAKTAILYGAVTGLSAQLFELLKKGTRFRIKKKSDVNVYADFLGEKIKADIGIDISLTLRGIISMLLAAGIAFVKAKMAVGTKGQPRTQEDSKASVDKK